MLELAKITGPPSQSHQYQRIPVCHERIRRPEVCGHSATRLRVECGDLSPLWYVAERRWGSWLSDISKNNAAGNSARAAPPQP